MIVVGWWWSILTCDVIEAEKKRSGAKSAPRSEKALLEGKEKVLLGAPEQSASAEHYFSHNNNNKPAAQPPVPIAVPPTPLPTLPLPTRRRHYRLRRRHCPTDHRRYDERRGATTSLIAVATVIVTAPTSPLHRPPHPRRRSRPSRRQSDARIGMGRDFTSSRPRGRGRRRWLPRRRCVGEDERPGEGEGGHWSVMHA